MEIVVKNNGLEEIYGMTREYPYVMHEADTSGLLIPWHWHEELEFNYIAEGGIDVVTNNGTYSFDEGEAFFCNSNVLCKMVGRQDAGRVHMYSHLFHAVFLGGHFRSVFETKYLAPVLNDKDIEIIEICGRTRYQKEMLHKLEMVSAFQKERGGVEFETRNVFSEIWLLLLEEIKTNKPATQSVDLKNQERILTMIAYIQRHYPEKLTLNAIAGSAAVSGRECLRCFQKNIGKTPFEYLMEYRIERASKLLARTGKPVVEISFDCGFSSNAYFGKKFKELRGVSPGAYRKKSQKNN